MFDSSVDVDDEEQPSQRLYGRTGEMDCGARRSVRLRAMPMFDKPLAELREFRPDRDEQPDFDAFWTRTLDEARTLPLE
ncbi:MAG: acetylxylan esterase, partial [Jiangellaceae bacterium]